MEKSFGPLLFTWWWVRKHWGKHASWLLVTKVTLMSKSVNVLVGIKPHVYAKDLAHVIEKYRSDFGDFLLLIAKQPCIEDTSNGFRPFGGHVLGNADDFSTGTKTKTFISTPAACRVLDEEEEHRTFLENMRRRRFE
ncbi:hypothetical protein IAQ61_003769 [Plenodomus lingam]|nr:hypothetical protein IAQ61_003769 [Plenodomus lingam]